MHIVVIGGGAAGMACAHYLTKKHRVTLLEKQPLLGGNVRTINRNVESKILPDGVFIDNGVIEFHREHSPSFSSLVKELGLELVHFQGGSTGLYMEDGRSYHMPGAIRQQHASPIRKSLHYLRLLAAMRHLVPIGLRMQLYKSDSDKCLDDLLGDDVMSKWMKMLLMYGYSIPYAELGKFPAPLAIYTLLQSGIGTQWVRLEGGVYRYMEEILRQAGDKLEVITGLRPDSVTRTSTGVVVELPSRSLKADAVVFATPPDQVLPLLTDSHADECRLFSAWEANHVETIIHTDQSIYENWKTPGFTEFDLFEKQGGKDAGYNAYLNRLCGLPDEHEIKYFLAYNMEDRVDSEKIIDRQRHHTPLYTAPAAACVDEIKASNGFNNTFHAGAYLYNGLHEGAIESALAVRELLS